MIMEISQDISDLRHLLVQARRDNSKQLLNAELDRLQVLLKEQQQQQSTQNKPSSAAERKTYDKRLTEYAWDQTNKFVKFYITLKNVHTVPADRVTCSFNDRSFKLRVNDLDGVNYEFPFTNLLEVINSEASKFRVRNDTVVITLAKKAGGASDWSHLTTTAKQAEAARSSKYDEPMKDDADPSAGIMNLMKKMYDEGDDEMKRTINKAWVESREKQAAGGMMM